MNREVVERLAIDCAAGELNEDSRSLFEAYLAEHPGAKEWAQDILHLYRQTETAISSKTATTGVGIAAVCIKSRRAAWARWRPAMRWAAVVFVAALVGAGAGRWSKSPLVVQKPDRAIASATPSVAPASLDSEAAAGGFWRAKALAMFEPGPYRERDAALQAGGLRQKYEHYIKERYHD